MPVTRQEAVEARLTLRRFGKEQKAGRAPRTVQSRAAPKVDHGEDPAFISWLHGIGCIACAILGQAPREHAHIEAAHQKAQDASRGWHKKLSKRPPDRQSAPICAWHHRLAPGCCDPAQAKFWAVLNVDVIAYCTDLYAAFKAGGDGAAVLRDHVRRARG